MADTTYVAFTTKVTADTMNDLNRLHYTIFSDPADLAAVKATLHAAPGAIGGDTPAAGAFTTLSASSTLGVTGATTASTIDASGNVNIAGHLIMDGTDKQIQALAGSDGTPAVSAAGDPNTGLTFPGSDVLGFSAGGTQRGRISAAHWHFSNTGSYQADTNHQFLTSAGAGAAASDAGFVTAFVNTHASLPQGISIRFTAAAPDDNSQMFLRCKDNAADRMIVYSDGDVVNADNSYGAVSDETIKQDIVDSGSQWDDVKNLRVRKYRLRSDVAAGKDVQHIGMVAQEVLGVSPGLVGTTGENYTVQYSLAYMKMFKAFQEAQERIEALERRAVDLESRIPVVR